MSKLRQQLTKIAEESNVQPLIQDPIVEQKVEQPEVTTLNDSLYRSMCSLDIFYRQIKFFHWIIKGQDYIATHRFLDEVAEAVTEKIDLFAERLVFLKFVPEYEPNTVLSKSNVEYIVSPNAGLNEMIETLLKQFDTVLKDLKDSADKSASDYGTQQFVTEVIYDLEVYKHHIESFK